MGALINIWNNYQICYAIGYMLLLRPFLQKGIPGRAFVKGIDYLFYLSLLVFSTLKFAA
jgi:hypothetical protein